MANRPLDIDGTFNLRDIGGYETVDGRMTRTGVLYRADSLSSLTDDGRRALMGLGTGAIVDLRSSDERRDQPSALDGLSAEVHSLPLLAEAAPGAQLATVREGEEVDLSHGLENLYIAMVRGSGGSIAEAVRVVADGPGAVIVHCAAGKDRTGVTVAIVLDAVGVRREAVIADYAASGYNLTGGWMHRNLSRFAEDRLAGDHDLATTLLASPGRLIEATLQHIDAEFGGSSDYLRTHGMTDLELETLRDRLVGPAEP